MAAGDLVVDVEVLLAHARRLEMVTESVALAADAAGQVDLAGGAFGLLCAFLPPLVNTAEVQTGDAIAAARETVDAAAQGVVAMARSYASTDELAGSRLTQLGAGLVGQ